MEQHDRIETAWKTAVSLRERLSRRVERAGDEASRDSMSASTLIARLAQQLYLLEQAFLSMSEELPWEAFVQISVPGTARAGVREFAEQLLGMYSSWAGRRNMRLQEVFREQRPRRRVVLAVSGFGAYSILAPEEGLHVLEEASENGTRACASAGSGFDSARASGGVMGRDLEQQARLALEEGKSESLAIVRRYRRNPSPLVRDLVRPYRTGYVDEVLAGNFDLF